MPPMTSSRPGARAIAIGAPGSNRRRVRSISTNSQRSTVGAHAAPPPRASRGRAAPAGAAVRWRRESARSRNRPRPRRHPRSAARRADASRVGHDDAALFGDERAADVVRMAASGGAQPPRGEDSGRISGRRSAMKRSCPAAARRADRRWRRIDPRSRGPCRSAARAERAAHDRLVDGGQLVACAGEEARDRWRSRARSSPALDGRSRNGGARR